MKSDKVMAATMMVSRRAEPPSERRTSRRKVRAMRRSIFAGLPTSPGQEEVLVVDDRAHLRPARIVESKLTRLLQEASVPVSQLQMRGLLRAR
jgi:hypothetical protein